MGSRPSSARGPAVRLDPVLDNARRVDEAKRRGCRADKSRVSTRTQLAILVVVAVAAIALVGLRVAGSKDDGGVQHGLVPPGSKAASAATLVALHPPPGFQRTQCGRIYAEESEAPRVCFSRSSSLALDKVVVARILTSLALSAYAKDGGSLIDCSGSGSAFQQCNAFALAGDYRVEVQADSPVFTTPSAVRGTSGTKPHGTGIAIESDRE